MNGINVIINAFIHGLDPVGNINLPLQKLRLWAAGQGFHLFNQFIGFFVGNKFRLLHRIHQ